MNNYFENTVLIRGAGELASSAAVILQRVGFRVIMTELPIPLAIRRTVCFSDAMLNGSSEVEGVTAIFSHKNYTDILNDGNIVLFQDSADLIKKIKPKFYVDARMLKKQMPNRRSNTIFFVGLGPGFTVGINCDAIIETKRGHNLGRVIWNGSAQPNTGIPGKLGGESMKRVIHSPADGSIKWFVTFGDIVEENQIIGKINNHEIITHISGVIRGLISPKVNVVKGMKIADVDSRGKEIDYTTLSDKARCVGRGVLEAIMVSLNC